MDRKTKTINDAVKVWKDKHLKDVKKLNVTERKIYEEIEGMRSTYGNVYVESMMNYFDKKYKGGTLGEFMRENCSKLVKLYVPERLVEDYYNIVDEYVKFPYTRGYYRRTLRTNQVRVHVSRAVRLMYGYQVFGMFNASVKEYLADELGEEWLEVKREDYWCGSSGFTDTIDDIIAARINSGDSEVIDIIKKSLTSKNNTVIVTVELIRAIIKSQNAELRHLLGDFFIAAKLQEGVRQAICENADCGLSESLIEIMDLIEREKLLRFSAVRRAVATWTGICNVEQMDRINDKVFACVKDAITNTESARKMIWSDDSVQIVSGLWGIGFYDVIEAIACVREMMEHGTRLQILTASYFNRMLGETQFKTETAAKVLERYSDDLEMAAAYMPTYISNYQDISSGIVRGAKGYGVYSEREARSGFRKLDAGEFNRTEEELLNDYEVLRRIRENIGKKKLEFAPCIFPWYQITLKSGDIVARMALIAYCIGDDEHIDEVCQWLSEIDGTYSERSIFIELLLHNPKTDKQRNALIDYLKDKETYSRRCAFEYLKELELTEDEYRKMETFLRYKNDEIRRYTIELLGKQDEAGVKESIIRLLESKNENIRMAGLDLAKGMCEEGKAADIKKTVTDILGNQELSAKLQILYDEIVKSDENVESEGGLKYGLYDDTIIPVIPHEEPDLDAFHNYFNMTKKEMDKKFREIFKFIVSHFRDEYQTFSSTKILGNGLYMIAYGGDLLLHDKYPFKELWGELYDRFIQTPQTFYNLKLTLFNNFDEHLFDTGEYKHYKKMAVKLYGRDHFMYSVQQYTWEDYYSEDESPYDTNIAGLPKMINDIFRIIESLKDLKLPENIALAAVNYAIEIDENERWYKFNDYDKDVYYNNLYDECNNFIGDGKFGCLLTDIKQSQDADERKQVFCSLYNLDRAYGLQKMPANLRQEKYTNKMITYKLNLLDYIRAYTEGIIDENEVYRCIFDIVGVSGSILEMSYVVDKSTEDKDNDLYKNVNKFYRNVVDTVLSVELKRGDSKTVFSEAIFKITRIYGMDRMIDILKALGNTPLDREVHYRYSVGVGRKECLSHLLKVCVPKSEDNAAELAAMVKENKISTERLIEVAMYAPQWMKIIEEYLGCDGFSSGCYYFMAHMNENFDNKTEAIIAKYTPLTKEELNDGAFDINWFFEAYEKLGAEMFGKLYEAAKYISDGNKHTRARKYADAALGRVTRGELEAAIKDKRNKDLLMSYGLLPFDGPTDVCERYEFIQEFLKESKQFGAQRRATEAKAVEMSLKNLAYTSGYSDELRLTLAMESTIVKNNVKYFEKNPIGDYQVQIVVDKNGKASTQISKGDKVQKSIPAPLKKDSSFLEIKDFEKKLKEQNRRCIKMFENAMENRVNYTYEEIKNLSLNPVINAVIDKLVFVPENENGECKGTLKMLGEIDKQDALLRIAHPVDFYRSGQWEKWQRHFFELAGEGIIQPFKQVFRELYLKNDEELETGFSRQFAGYQISPSRTLAALKNRQWVADYENGLQKIYYKDNIIAVLYAMADWFSPADVEAPTLEYVVFYNRKTLEIMKIADVPDIIYSEVCRDTDLAVSLAHVGGVDPVTTHSTIEMRTVIAEFNMELFKISNVTFEKSHAFINGKYGQYSIHLGSGVIHKIGGSMISVLPVHTQKRGKLFLPFIDDDPKTAEIMSKIILFARDDKIKDPYIMKQIQNAD